MNNSKSFPSTIANDSKFDNPQFGPFNITFFSGYNNSNQRWVSHIFNHTWANSTILEPYGVETFWFYSDYNITWNGTIITTNWTAYYR